MNSEQPDIGVLNQAESAAVLQVSKWTAVDQRQAARTPGVGRLKIGDEAKIGMFVEIQKNAKIGKRCKISSHTFICEGVTIEDECFIGHHVVFINDRFPAAVNFDGSLQTDADWSVVKTRVCKRASVGSGAIILCGVTIGEGALVGAGSVVTKNVPPYTIVAGNPSRVLRQVQAPQFQDAMKKNIYGARQRYLHR
jgi:UDP-2-acetamido-3-amino-2,3-dideoxy-glucuronate N-acetyltransferase